MKIEETKKLNMNKILMKVNELIDKLMSKRQVPTTTICSKYLN